ncbi:SH3 domain-containing protein [Pedobacter sp.]|uniref:SH3 domain-containing protein n=1 Tax=Pedobacter sp. TaxID=1411316 RepID=UPI00396CC472
MQNKRQIIFLIVGTFVFSFIIYGLASSDHKTKQARLAPNAQILKNTKVYESPDLTSRVIDSLQQGIEVTIGEERSNFYRLIKVKGGAGLKEGFLLKEAVTETK